MVVVVVVIAGTIRHTHAHTTTFSLHRSQLHTAMQGRFVPSFAKTCQARHWYVVCGGEAWLKHAANTHLVLLIHTTGRSCACDALP